MCASLPASLKASTVSASAVSKAFLAAAFTPAAGGSSVIAVVSSQQARALVDSGSAISFLDSLTSPKSCAFLPPLILSMSLWHSFL